MRSLKLLSELSMGRLLVVAVLFTAGYYTAYFNDGSELEAQILNAETQLQTETIRRIGIEKIIKKEEEMRGNLLQLERNLEVVKSKIPVEFKDTEMSAILNLASRASGVTIRDLSIINSGFNNAAIDPKSIRPEDLIEEVKFNMVFSGSYSAFLIFLDYLSKDDKIIKVKNFNIERNSVVNVDDDTIVFKGEVAGFKQSIILRGGAQVIK